MSEKHTTVNGFEIKNPVEDISAEDFRKKMSQEYGIDAETPAGRIEQLKNLSVEGVAILLEDINKSVQGSKDSLMNHESVMNVGKKKTISLEDRYDVFFQLVNDIKNTPEDINPARVGDTLALGVVLLHPFHDGNGRTARVIGLMFRDDYDSEEYKKNFSIVTKPGVRVGAFKVDGYIPKFDDESDNSNPEAVSKYLKDLLTTENSEEEYSGCFGVAPLRCETSMDD